MARQFLTLRASTRDRSRRATFDLRSRLNPCVVARRSKFAARASTTFALAVLVVIGANGCTRSSAPTHHTVVHIDDGDAFYANAFSLPKPIQGPLDAREKSVVDVKLLLPEGARIDATPRGQLILPSGARIDRVERWRQKDDTLPIADVRGALILDGDRRTFHVLRPDGETSGKLFGASFAAYSALGEKSAHDFVTSEMEAGRGFTSRISKEKLPRAIKRFRDFGTCNACHVVNKPEAKSVDARHENGTPENHGGTGAQGFYTLDALFLDEGVIEDHRPVQPAFTNQFVTRRCHDVVITDVNRSSCDDKSLMRASLDVRAALSANDLHAERVCAARQRLATRMTDVAKEAVAKALAVCDKS